MYDTVMMDSHTLELLEFHKVRELLAGYTPCSLGKELALQLEPSTDPDRTRGELAQVRQKLAELDERVQNVIKRLLRDPELRKILRYPNATVNGDHYVLPVAVNHRHKLQGVVHRTSSTGETVFIEPAAVASLSAERSVLKSEEDREVRRILRRLTNDLSKVARPLSSAIETIARLDLLTAKAKYS